MKKKTDFLFVYEVKNRELESVCLLKQELEHRGYTVEVAETWQNLHHYYEPRDAAVIVAFALYGDGQVNYVTHFAKKAKKIVNLQWEQVYTIGDEEAEGGTFWINGRATEGVHIAWGQHTYDRLTKDFGISPRKVHLAGHIGLDFLKPALSGYYQDRDTLFREFNLDPHKPMCLYISSFSYVDMPQQELESPEYQGLAYSANDFQRLSVRSQKTTLEWIEAALKEKPDVEFVYRPHPAEVGNVALFELEQRQKNFHVIRDLSIKQWILAADKIYTWYSTSVAEVFAAHKSCGVVRPERIPREMEIRIYDGCPAIETQEDFLKDFTGEETRLLDTALLNHYYKLADGEYAYQSICDKLEEVLKDDSYAYDFVPEMKTSFVTRIKRRIFPWIHRVLGHMWQKEYKWLHWLGARCEKFRLIAERDAFTVRMIQNNYADEAEIQKIQQHIASVLNANSTSQK